MATVLSLQINEEAISISKYPFSHLVGTKQTFAGQKIHHPFETKELVEGKRKKIVYVDKFASSELENAILTCDRYDIKHDGSCGAVSYNDISKKLNLYARYDIKRNKEGEFDCPLKTSNWIQCEDKPTDVKATHWPHFRPCDEDKKAYKWFLESTNNLPQIEKFDGLLTVEYMGKKINWKNSDPINENCLIVPHGLLKITVPKLLRAYDGFKQIFEAIPTIEGLVAYTNLGPLKIRREMFEGLSWPGEPAEYLEKYGLTSGGLSCLTALKN
jgi:hypothetical protein